MMKKPLWQKVWVLTMAAGITYYIVKTMIARLESNTLDAIVLMYSVVSLVVYLYFFKSKKSSE